MYPQTAHTAALNMKMHIMFFFTVTTFLKQDPNYFHYFLLITSNQNYHQSLVSTLPSLNTYKKKSNQVSSPSSSIPNSSAEFNFGPPALPPLSCVSINCLILTLNLSRFTVRKGVSRTARHTVPTWCCRRHLGQCT
jgi:hypothetical protein